MLYFQYSEIWTSFTA